MNESIFEVIDRMLKFLITDFGFVEVSRSDDRVLGVLVTYANTTTAVVMSFERREQYAQVDLWHLVEGKGPRNSRFNTSYEDANRIALNQLMGVRTPSIAPWLMEKPVGDSWFEPELLVYAEFLREHATDVLRGDFSVLDTIRRSRESNP